MPREVSAEDDLAARLADLRLGGGVQVNVTVVLNNSGPQSGSPRREEHPTRSHATGRGTAGSRAGAARRPQRQRYYVVVRAPADHPELLGIWRATWRALEAQLPTGQFFGSGVFLRGFDVVGDAEAFWGEHHPERAAVHRVAEE